MSSVERRELDSRPVGRGLGRQAVAAPADAGVVDLGVAAGRVGVAERLERLLGVRVGGVLGEDREDQLARGVEPRLPDLLAVRRGEAVEHVPLEPRPVAPQVASPRRGRDRPSPRGLLRLAPSSRLRGRWSSAGRRLAAGRRHRVASTCRVKHRARSRASRSPQRSSGAGPGGHRLLDRLRRSVTGDGDRADRRRAPRSPPASRRRRPRCTATPASRAQLGDAERGLAERGLGVDPALAGDHEVRAGELRRRSPVSSMTSSTPGTSADGREPVGERTGARTPTPPAAPAPGVSRSSRPVAALERVGEARRARRRARGTSAGVAPFCGP